MNENEFTPITLAASTPRNSWMRRWALRAPLRHTEASDDVSNIANRLLFGCAAGLCVPLPNMVEYGLLCAVVARAALGSDAVRWEFLAFLDRLRTDLPRISL